MILGYRTNKSIRFTFSEKLEIHKPNEPTI